MNGSFNFNFDQFSPPSRNSYKTVLLRNTKVGLGKGDIAEFQKTNKAKHAKLY